MQQASGPVTPNALTFDVEHWHDATLVGDHVTEPEDHIERSVRIVLDLLDRHAVRATFFVLGRVAEAYPGLVRSIRDGGHELASHGQTHTPLFELTPAQFAAELADSADAIAAAAGVRPRGFRAPNFSITPETDWAFPVLDESDYRYDSSVFPRRTPMYGVARGPRSPYVVAPDDPFEPDARATTATGLVEAPLAVSASPLRLPIAGGFYARVLPSSLLFRGIARLNRLGRPANVYFHPWEFNPAVRTDELPVPQRLVSFYGIDTLGQRIDGLLSRFEFGPLGTLLGDERLPDAPLRDHRRDMTHATND